MMKPTKDKARRGPRVGYLLRMYPRFSQTFVVNEILELERQGLDLRIASLRKPDDGVFHESISRVRARATYLPESLLSDGRTLGRSAWSALRRHPGRYLRAVGGVLRNTGATKIDLAQAAALKHWAKKNRIDHVHVHFGTNEASVAMLADRMGGLSYSLTLHAFDIFRENVDRPLLVEKINNSRFVVTVSEFNRRYILDHFPGVNADKVRVGYNGIDLEVNQPAEAIEREPLTVLAVGRLIEKKGFIHLIRAIGFLRQRGLQVRCDIAGDGREESRLTAEIESLGLSGCVKLLGPVEQGRIRELMQRAACFALPCVQARDGNMDALPTVLLESLACGCPSVSTRVSGVPEIIENGVSGLLVDPEDVAALADAIGAVLSDSAMAERLSQGGRKRAEERFDVRRNAGALHEWFAEAVTRTRPADGVRSPRSSSGSTTRSTPAASSATAATFPPPTVDLSSNARPAVVEAP